MTLALNKFKPATQERVSNVVEILETEVTGEKNASSTQCQGFMNVFNPFKRKEFIQVLLALEFVEAKHVNKTQAHVTENPFDKIFPLGYGHLRKRMAQVVVSYFSSSRLQKTGQGTQLAAQRQGDATR